MSKSDIELKISTDDPDVAYLYLPDYPRSEKPTFNAVEKQVRLYDLIEGYSGPDVYLDFNQEGALIGIEILA